MVCTSVDERDHANHTPVSRFLPSFSTEFSGSGQPGTTRAESDTLLRTASAIFPRGNVERGRASIPKYERRFVGEVSQPFGHMTSPQPARQVGSPVISQPTCETRLAEIATNGSRSGCLIVGFVRSSELLFGLQHHLPDRDHYQGPNTAWFLDVPRPRFHTPAVADPKDRSQT